MFSNKLYEREICWKVFYNKISQFRGVLSGGLKII